MFGIDSYITSFLLHSSVVIYLILSIFTMHTGNAALKKYSISSMLKKTETLLIGGQLLCTHAKNQVIKVSSASRKNLYGFSYLQIQQERGRLTAWLHSLELPNLSVPFGIGSSGRILSECLLFWIHTVRIVVDSRLVITSPSIWRFGVIFVCAQHNTQQLRSVQCHLLFLDGKMLKGMRRAICHDNDWPTTISISDLLGLVWTVHTRKAHKSRWETRRCWIQRLWLSGPRARLKSLQAPFC